jgi:hypothetical protein
MCEVFYQVVSNAIHLRRFINGDYSEPYAVVGPLEALEGTSIAATAVNDGAEGTNLVAYIAPNGYLKVHTRKNVNISLSDSGPYSTPVQIVKGSGQRSGLAAVSWPGTAKIFFVVDKKILELSSNNLTNVVGTNWTIAEVRSG